MRMHLAQVTAFFAFASSAACVSMPDPPPHPEDLSALAAQYEYPRAVLPIELVQRLVDEGQRRAELGEILNRLRFVRTAVVDTSVGVEQSGNFAEFLVQGTITATVPCPGDGSTPTVDAGANGVLRLKLGVEESRLRRGFEGSAEQCRLLATSPSAPDQRVTVSADIVGDLGADLSVGNTMLSDILIKLTNVRGTAVSTAGTVELSEHEYHFRLTRNEAFEVLLDPASLGLPDLGSVVFALRADGSVALRESRGEWICGGGGEACVLR